MCSRGTKTVQWKRGRILVELRADICPVLTVCQIVLKVLYGHKLSQSAQEPYKGRVLGSFPFYRRAHCSSENKVGRVHTANEVGPGTWTIVNTTLCSLRNLQEPPMLFLF